MTTVNLVIVLSFLTLAFGSNLEIKTSGEAERIPSFEHLPTNIIVDVSAFLDNPFESLPVVSKSINVAMSDVKAMQLSRLKSLVKNPFFEDMKWSPEINKLLKLNPVILRHFFDDFVVSRHCFKVMNRKFLDHSLPIILNSRFGYDNSQLFSELSLQFVRKKQYNLIERLVINYGEWVSNAQYRMNIPFNLELIQYLFRNNKFIFKHIIENQEPSSVPRIISWLFNSKDMMTFDDFFGFFTFLPIQARLQGMMISISENEFKLDFSEDKRAVLMRNQKIIDTVFEDNSYLIKGQFCFMSVLNLIRYSESSDNSEIIEKYLTEKSDLNDFLSFVVIEQVAQTALLGGNLDLFREAFNLLNDKRFSMQFYLIVINSRNLIQILPESALLNYFNLFWDYNEYTRFHSQIVIFDPIMRLEVIARVELESRSMEILDKIFIDDESGILIALAFYFPLNHLIEKLSKKPGMIPLLLARCFPYSRKIRNNLNNLVEIVYEILKLISNLSSSTPKLNDLMENIFNFCQSLHIVKLIAESKNNLMISFICSNIHYFSIRGIFDEINTDPKFKRNLMRPEVHALRSKLVLDFRSLVQLNLSAHELVELFKVLSLEIGNFDFDFDSLTLNENYTSILIDEHSRQTVNNFKTVQIDKLLVLLALESFNRQKQAFEPILRGNLMLLNSFGIFQLWWERNPITFEKFAPSQVVEAFRKRIIYSAI